VVDRLSGTAGVVLLFVLVVASHVALGLMGVFEPSIWPGLAVDVVVWVVLVGLVRGLESRLQRVTTQAERARSAIDLLDDAVLVVEAASLRVQFSNRAADRLAGGISMVGNLPWELGPWPPEEQLREALAAVDRDDDEDVAALTVARDDRVLEFTAERVAWQGDDAVVLLARDITQRHEAEARLEERERRFRALAEDAAGVVYRIRVRPTLEVEYVSQQLVEVLGYQPAEFYVDPTLIMRRARPEQRASLDLSSDSHAYGEQGMHSYSMRHADGRWLWIEDHHTPEHDEDGQLVAVQGIAFDVSAQWETEKALGEAIRKQEVAAETMHRTARVERTFLQSISHEIRTPMTSALGFARMLHTRREAIPPEQQDSLLERLVANIERIEELVGRFLEFDRYARGDAEIDRTLERLDDVVGAVAEQVDMEGRELRTDLELVMALVDRRRIEQSVEGMLLNAVRHTPPETVVELALTATDDTARIVVQDDGPGVAAEVVDHVFAPFTQGPASHEAANPGVGLGLAMVRVSARLHGGEVAHEPVSPHGARFILELPLTDGPVGTEGMDGTDETGETDGMSPPD